ncbi:MAG: PRC-barrel domain-containing protein, partial [Spirochaetales bacterium]|nr:PRC-barrel domain-containing protein [Spirochaetales bacterium]
MANPISQTRDLSDANSGKRNSNGEGAIMLRNVKELNSYTLNGRDGKVGKVNELYFDDQHWAVRYLVADTETWLTERQVLISPHALRSINEEAQEISVDLNRMQIEKSPAVDADKPVSRQREQELHSYYGWSPYWSMGMYAGVGYPVPGSLSGMVGAGDSAAVNPTGDPTLRSMQQVRGYHI